MGTCHTIFCMDILCGRPGFDILGIRGVLVYKREGKLLFQLMIQTQMTIHIKPKVQQSTAVLQEFAFHVNLSLSLIFV